MKIGFNLGVVMGGAPSLSLSGAQASVNGTDITVTATSSGDLTAGVFGVEWGIGAYTWAKNVPGAAANQSITIGAAEGIATGNTYDVRCYYNLNVLDPVGTRVYGTPTMSAVVAAAGDPYWANVVLQVGNENGANGTKTFLDQSNSAHSVVAINGDEVWSNTSVPTGLTTAIFMASGSSLLDCASHADFNFGGTTAAWTIACRFKAKDSGIYGLCSFGDHSATHSICIFGWNDGDLHIYLSSDGTNNNIASSLAMGFTTAMDGNWHELEVTFDGSNYRFFLDGTIGSGSFASSTKVYNGNVQPFMGGVYGSANWQGRIASFQLTKGTCRHTSNFTPPSLPLLNS